MSRLFLMDAIVSELGKFKHYEEFVCLVSKIDMVQIREYLIGITPTETDTPIKFDLISKESLVKQNGIAASIEGKSVYIFQRNDVGISYIGPITSIFYH